MDFEKFCETYGLISDKSTGEKIKLKLNGAQRCVYEYLEKCRVNKFPCRLLILKSRQLGISTLLQYYFTWLLIYHCEMENFLSLCHNKQLSESFINNMINIYSRYNKEYKPKRTGTNVLEDFKGNHLLYGSAKSYNSTRGYNISVAHMSESAFWHSKSSDWSQDVIRSVMGSVGNRGGTFVVMESTSDGKNNYFYKLWQDSINGLTGYYPIFLGWQLCEYYSCPVDGKLENITEREKNLLENGYSQEQIMWYRNKRKEFQDESSFLREFPCTAEESFSNSSNEVFSKEELSLYERMIKDGKYIDFTMAQNGDLVCHDGNDFTQWQDRYIDRHHLHYFVVVTIGSCIDESKYNVITCWSLQNGDEIELCLERRFLCDIDELIEQSIVVAKYYYNAMLIVEVNSLNRLGMSMKDYYIRKLRQKYFKLFIQDGNVGYMMSHKRKLRGLFAFRRRLKANHIKDYSKYMLEEMENYVIQDEEISAAIDCHDDVLLCRLILNDILDDFGPQRPPINPNEIL